MRKLNEQDVLKIKQLNIKLQNEEARIKSFAEKLSISLEQEKQQKLFDDYIFSSSLSVFSNNTLVNKKFGVETGNPLLEDNSYTLFAPNQSSVFYIDDWNEWKKTFPIEQDRMCYTMHCIIDQSRLNFEDILAIDDVWIDLKITYQFFVS